MKDIFVEVDWMKKEIEGRWYADGSGGKYYVPGFTIEYRMKEGAQNKVIRPFGKHDIALHIDDGCMGGGEAIDYLPVLAWSMGRNSVCMPGSDNDFWDVKWGNGWDVDLDYHSAWKNLDHHYGYWWNYR